LEKLLKEKALEKVEKVKLMEQELLDKQLKNVINADFVKKYFHAQLI